MPGPKRRALLFALGLFVGCGGSSVTLLGTWKRPNHTAQTFRRVVVVAITDDRIGREVVEKYVASELADRGVRAVVSSAVLPAKIDGLDREAIKAHIRTHGIDAALTLRLVQAQVTAERAPPVVRPSFREQGIGFYGYYPSVFQPTLKGASIEVSRRFVIESNFYALDQERLVWTAKTEGEDPPSLTSFAEQYSRLLVDALLRERVLAP